MSMLSDLPATRSTPLLPELDWHTLRHSGHVVQFYSDDRFLIEPLVRFIGDALIAGQAAVIVATQEHRSQLAELLREPRVDLSAAIRDGRCVFLDASRTLAKFMRKDHPDPASFAEVIGEVLEGAKAAAFGQRIAVFGEMVALLWADGNRDAAVELERLWNDLARQHAFSLHCAYPLGAFRDEDDSQFFLNICCEHSSVIPCESYTSLAGDEERLRNIAQLQQKAQALEFQKDQKASLHETKLKLEAEAVSRQEELRRLGDSEQALRELSTRLLRSQDEERRRLGLSLHDSVAQYLAVLKMGLDMLGSNNAPTGDFARKLMAECIPLLEQSIEQLRSTSYLLYPPMIDESGLRTAISWYLSGFTNHTGIKVTLDVAPGFGRLPGDIELALFRVLQESLANVHRHSGSSTAVVALRMEDGSVRLEVLDHGKGIAQDVLQSCDRNPGKLGVGLRAMQERLHELGGQLQVSSNGQGTTLTASVPLPA